MAYEQGGRREPLESGHGDGLGDFRVGVRDKGCAIISQMPSPIYELLQQWFYRALQLPVVFSP